MNLRKIIWDSPKDFFLSGEQERVLEKIKGSSSRGIILLSGEPGVGKTYIARHLTEDKGIYCPLHKVFDLKSNAESEQGTVVLDDIHEMNSIISRKIKELRVEFQKIIIIHEKPFGELIPVIRNLPNFRLSHKRDGIY